MVLERVFSDIFHLPDPRSKKRNYKFGQTLGCGSYGVVKEAWHPHFGKCAVKLIVKKNANSSSLAVNDEIRTMAGLSHPNIVKLYEVFESRKKVYIVTQLAEGGELFERICERGRFTERDAALTIYDVLQAIQHLHHRNIVHRDIKPENLLYDTRETNAHLLLVDFGIAQKLNDDIGIMNMAGSHGYAAPEILRHKAHGKPVDMWSLGVTTYCLLCGYSPFHSSDNVRLREDTLTANYEFHEKHWSGISDAAKGFISRLLVTDPDERMTVDEALEHPWIREYVDAGTVPEETPEKDLLPALAPAFNARRNFRRAVALVRLNNRIMALDRLIKDSNSDNNGEQKTEADGSSNKRSSQQEQQTQLQEQQKQRGGQSQQKESHQKESAFSKLSRSLRQSKFGLSLGNKKQNLESELLKLRSRTMSATRRQWIAGEIFAEVVKTQMDINRGDKSTAAEYQKTHQQNKGGVRGQEIKIISSQSQKAAEDKYYDDTDNGNNGRYGRSRNNDRRPSNGRINSGVRSTGRMIAFEDDKPHVEDHSETTSSGRETVSNASTTTLKAATIHKGHSAAT